MAHYIPHLVSVIGLAILFLPACEQKPGLSPADIKPSITVSPISVQPSQAIPTSTPSRVGSPSTPTALSTANSCPITTKIFTSTIDASFLFTLIPEECQEQFVDFQYLVQLKSLGSKPTVLAHKTLAHKTLFLELYNCNLPPEIKEDGEYNIHVVGHLKSGQIIEGNTVTTPINKLSEEVCSRKGGGASLGPP